MDIKAKVLAERAGMDIKAEMAAPTQLDYLVVTTRLVQKNSLRGGLC